MASPQGYTYEEIMALLKENGSVALGIIAFHVEHQEFQVYAFGDQNPDEVNALLEKIKLRVRF